MYKLKQFLEENQDFKNYINTRINDNVDINIIYDELEILHNDFKIDDLIEYKNSDDFKKQIPVINNEINIKDDIEKISFNINFDENLKIFKAQNPIEQNNSCNDLLNEINYKLLYIINEKLNHFQDRIPKDDIQAFKIINDLVYKNEFENVDPPETLEMLDMKKYSNDMIKKMIQSKYLSRKDTIDIMKLIFKESWTKAY
jgi:outer membrane receptor for Fe3+-dicitrate